MVNVMLSAGPVFPSYGQQPPAPSDPPGVCSAFGQPEPLGIELKLRYDDPEAVASLIMEVFEVFELDSASVILLLGEGAAEVSNTSTVPTKTKPAINVAHFIFL